MMMPVESTHIDYTTTATTNKQTNTTTTKKSRNLMILLSAPKTTLMDELSEILICHQWFSSLLLCVAGSFAVAFDVSSH